METTLELVWVGAAIGDRGVDFDCSGEEESALGATAMRKSILAPDGSLWFFEQQRQLVLFVVW